MQRRTFLKVATVSATGAVANPLSLQHASAAVPKPKPFELDEITIAALQNGMARGKYNAVRLAKAYLSRIDDIDRHGPTLNSVIEINPDALSIAAALFMESRSCSKTTSIRTTA